MLKEPNKTPNYFESAEDDGRELIEVRATEVKT